MGLVVMPGQLTQRLEEFSMATCKTCNGAKTIRCPVCNGSGKVSGRSCNSCGGDKKTVCPTCKGTGKQS